MGSVKIHAPQSGAGGVELIWSTTTSRIIEAGSSISYQLPASYLKYKRLTLVVFGAKSVDTSGGSFSVKFLNYDFGLYSAESTEKDLFSYLTVDGTLFDGIFTCRIYGRCRDSNVNEANYSTIIDARNAGTELKIISNDNFINPRDLQKDVTVKLYGIK